MASRPSVVGELADGPDLSVLVVTFNSARFASACLDAVPGALSRHSGEVIVVDNASVDGTPDVIRARFPAAVVLANTTNRGFARANNQAIAMARGRHLVLLNPDTVPAPGSLDRLVDLLDADQTVGAAAPSLRNPDGTDQGTARSFPTPATALFGRRSPLTRAFPRNRWSRRYLPDASRPPSGSFAVDWVSGACLVVRREVVESVGVLDPSFFMYWEDADWCRRMKTAGWSVVCEPAAVVLHDEGGQRARPAAQEWNFHRSAYRYYAKHHIRPSARALRIAAACCLYGRASVVILATSLRGAPMNRAHGQDQP